MRRDAIFRTLVCNGVVALTTATLFGQAGQKPSAAVPYSALPSNPSTSLPGSTPKRTASHRAAVTYTDGLLTVSASNSSLREIVRGIASATGMKVTGSVSDDRVFGTYGPAAPAQVLNTLLDGTGSNMLLVQDANQNPTELVLTPQRGGPTPPNPNASALDDDDAGNAAASQPVPPPTPGRPNVGPPSVVNRPQSLNSAADLNQSAPNPAATQPSTTTETVVFPPIDATSTPSTATATPSTSTSPAPPASTPDSVKTPQQIFEQLQRLRQQQQQNGPTTAAPQ